MDVRVCVEKPRGIKRGTVWDGPRVSSGRLRNEENQCPSDAQVPSRARSLSGGGLKCVQRLNGRGERGNGNERRECKLKVELMGTGANGLIWMMQDTDEKGGVTMRVGLGGVQTLDGG